MNSPTYFPTERRRHPRTQLQMVLHGIRLDPDGGDVVSTLQMTDISKCGMGAVSERSLYPGQRLVMCLPLSTGGARRNIYATVVRCRQGQEEFRIGLEFDLASSGAWCRDGALVAAA